MNTVRPLRIGVLVARKEGFENWELMIFDRIMADPRFSLITFIVHPNPFGHLKASRLFELESHLERRLLARQRRYTPQTFDANRQRFDDLRVLGTYAAADIDVPRQLVNERELDLVIRLTPASLPSDAIRDLPFGEWAFNFCDQRSRKADWFSYRDVISKSAATELLLYAKQDDARVTSIASPSFNIKFSAARNAAFLKERAVTLLMRELGRLADSRELKAEPSRRNDVVKPPSSVDMVRYAGGLSSHFLARAIKALRARMHSGSAIWTLYTGRGRIDDFDPRESVEIPPTKSDIKADPFLFQYGNECYLFYEAYADGDRKAHIAVGRFRGDKIEPVGIALSCDHHLSYPFVFRDGNSIFMMPETHQSRRIEIWRCVEFPLKWELYSTAFEGRSAADSVLTRHKGKWWLFTNLSDFHAYEDHCSELYLFEVDGPELKRIISHKHNPVVIGSTVARNGGRILERNGQLYRPSQCNAHGIYGYGLNIMEIEELSLTAYRERCIRTITPDFKKGLRGCHHFDAAGERYVVDARLSL
ncbi:glucosamine inositolphosphorylceramide transferase family protein [Rhizobium sullae]|uniref:glucosamine inositolphosphorylceramide transferase family protein n=1 Tax=Rhizobium sullae TaxID=50338 RepID=UPI000B34C19A|nr:hypothetical protein [Rhizobium sullae]